jgi:DNA-binding PadR family transcriptional regulator
MLELAILGLLKEQELHGYELKKRLVDTLGFASGVSFGSLYPALSRLEAAGAVKAVESRVPAVAPHTGSLTGELAAFRARKPSGARGGRSRKVYGITERGEALFEELLAAETQSSDDDRVFNLRLAFARYLPPDARLGMLERRRAHLSQRLIQLGTRVKAARDAYARSLVEHDREAAEHDLSWIERLIAAERAGRHAAADVSSVPAGPVSPGPAASRPAAAPASAPSQRARSRSGRRTVSVDGPTISGLRPSPQPLSPEEDTES